ncbi:AT-rich interactive domain-containing protein 3A-like isoform X2 [Anguilla rostrata]|uniref:AT-rich interactive domain-containing protein 3A-like isoform X2 n=1 Tax=Anguilla rostrata TaxID=7938 RepID=UPI0030D31C0D
MKLRAVMENLHRQQRAKLQMELEQQQAGQSQQPDGSLPANAGEQPSGSPAPERAQMAALAAMRAVATGLQRNCDLPSSNHSSAEEGEQEEEEEEEEEEDYKGMMGSDEELRKQKWDEEGLEEDFEDELGEEGSPTGRGPLTPGRGILLLPHRHLLPQSQALRAGLREPPHISPPLGPHKHRPWNGPQEQFRQLYELDSNPQRKEFLDDLFGFMQRRGSPVNRIPIMAKQVLDLFMLYQLVTEKGGLVEVINKKLWREITKGLSLPTSITSAAFTLRTQYMKYLYPYECDKRGLSNPGELQAAIDSNRREGRRQSFGSALFTYSPNGTPTMLSSPKLSAPSLGVALGTNGATLAPMQRIKKEDAGGMAVPGASRLPLALAGSSAAAVQAAMAAQMAALEQLRERLESGEPAEKKMALPGEEHQRLLQAEEHQRLLQAEEHHRLLQRALQHNLLAMTAAHVPMSVRVSTQEGGRDSALNLTTNGTGSISMSLELNGVVYTGVLFAQVVGPVPCQPTGSSGSGESEAPSGHPESRPAAHTPTSSCSGDSSPQQPHSQPQPGT